VSLAANFISDASDSEFQCVLNGIREESDCCPGTTGGPFAALQRS
jgi:hypothetical protein